MAGKIGRMTAVAAAGLTLSAAGAFGADGGSVRLAFLSLAREIPPALSNLDQPPSDEGVAGATLGGADNAAGGRFLKQTYELEKVVVEPEGDVDAAFAALIAAGHRIVALDLPGDVVARLARRPDAADALLINAAAPDDDLRGEKCAANLLHVAPSRAMQADALAQYMVVKRWTKWFLVVGPRPEDKLYADAVRAAAKKFGAKIVAEKAWSGEHDARRTAQAEIPVFTQGAGDYDVLIVADEIGDFGDFLLYRTWSPRPVAGTQGLVPTAWSRAHEQWGAAQLQSRFLKQSGRRMTPRDWGAWAAVRVVGEAASKIKSADPKLLEAYIRSPDFNLAGFKGVPLNFRPWDGQLRQPVLLSADRSLVSMSPQDGFLHPRTPLDTLGADAADSRCKLAKK